MKGTMLDLITILIVGFVFSVTIILVFLLNTEIQTGIQTANENLEHPVNLTYFEKAEEALLVFNTGFVLVMFAALLGSALMAFFLRSHPVFMVLSILSFIVIVVLTGIMSNIYTEIATQEALVSSANEFTLINLFWQNVPLWGIVGSIIIMIALYAKRGEGFEA